MPSKTGDTAAFFHNNAGENRVPKDDPKNDNKALRPIELNAAIIDTWGARESLSKSL